MRYTSFLFIGFGSFEAERSPQCMVRNPKNGEKTTVHVGCRPAFEASKALCGHVHGGQSGKRSCC